MHPLVQLAPQRARLPEWLRKPAANFEPVQQLKSGLRRLGLHTVCESARCPNLHECFEARRATFMILGNLCTRGCGFCSVPKSRHPGPLDPDEPQNVAGMARAMDLRYIVITSVNRDDLEDGGSEHFARTVRSLREALPEAKVETLTPDFNGDLNAVKRLLDAGPDVFNHNVETVARLYGRVRPQADYRQSLKVLDFAKNYQRNTGLRKLLTKSGAMLGLGETDAEIEQLLRDLLAAQVDVVTLGQYLQPSRRNLPVANFIPPEQFDHWREFGLKLGFKMVFSGPLVRSSYLADAVHTQANA